MATIPVSLWSTLFCLNCCRTDIEILWNKCVRLLSTLLIGSAFPIFPSFNVSSDKTGSLHVSVAA